MPRKKTSSRVSKKPAKSSSSKSSRVATKTAKKVGRATKKTTQRSSRQQPVAAASSQEPGTRDKQPILVPLDFSPYSEAALKYAAKLAESLQWPLVVLHVVHDPGEAPGYYQRVAGRKQQLRRLEDLARELLAKFMAKMVKQHRQHPVLQRATRVLVTGLPVTRILEVAEKLEPSMVVMGSAGRTGLSRFLLGSKTEQVLRMCRFPVTVVKASEDKTDG